jgi:hypothetical protein
MDMNRPTDDPKRHLLQLRVSEDFITALDEWRAEQHPLPSRSEAVRQLTMKSLAKAKPK